MFRCLAKVTWEEWMLELIGDMEPVARPGIHHSQTGKIWIWKGKYRVSINNGRLAVTTLKDRPVIRPITALWLAFLTKRCDQLDWVYWPTWFNIFLRKDPPISIMSWPPGYIRVRYFPYRNEIELVSARAPKFRARWLIQEVAKALNAKIHFWGLTEEFFLFYWNDKYYYVRMHDWLTNLLMGKRYGLYEEMLEELKRKVGRKK